MPGIGFGEIELKRISWAEFEVEEADDPPRDVEDERIPDHQPDPQSQTIPSEVRADCHRREQVDGAEQDSHENMVSLEVIENDLVKDHRFV